MRTLKFRHRIVLLVAVAGVALLAVTGVTLFLGRRSERQISAVETRYVPLLELDRDLKALYTRIPRTLEDAASAGEQAGLVQADLLRDQLAARIEEGAEMIRGNGGDPAALETELDAYYRAGRRVSAALIAGTAASALVTEIDRMKQTQETFAHDLDRATTPDHDRLAAAFTAARSSEHAAFAIDITVASAALLLMALLSSRIIRRTLAALREVSRGMERLARGELEPAIVVTTEDELGDLAREANHTAVQLLAAQQALHDKAEELARASRYKSEFLANMSHELRTPLNSIMILSKLLADNETSTLTTKQVELAHLIHRSGDELLALINDVLDLAKVEAGKQHIACETVVVAELAEYMRAMFLPLATQKHLALIVEVDPDAPAQLQSDRARIGQIMKNLLSNAIKFTERGTIAVRIARDEPDRISIAVTDSGIGIAADKLTVIFEAFAQAEGGTSRKYGGTGLGLTIAKQLAVRLGGDLGVESTLGHGSTFRVVLPVDGPPESSMAAEASLPGVPAVVPAVDARAMPPRTHTPVVAALAPGTDSSLDGKTVLVVDDDMRSIYSLSNALQTAHVRVLTAADGQEALDELEQHPDTDAVVIDIAMPRMTGHDAMRRIRAQPRFARLPIIALAASPAEVEQEAGATDYIMKPVDGARLLELLAKRIGATAES